MCIVIIKEKGAKFPKMADIKESAINNPDGFAIAWNNKGKIMTKRTLDQKEFIKTYSLISKLDPKETGVIIHARIKTHGSINLSNCHCWQDENFAFAHNGILSIHAVNDMTDSETFFRTIFSPLYIFGGWQYAIPAIQAIIGSSKFAFIDKDGNITKFGDYIKNNGCLYSNNSYARRESFTPKYPMYNKYPYNEYNRNYNNGVGSVGGNTGRYNSEYLGYNTGFNRHNDLEID